MNKQTLKNSALCVLICHKLRVLKLPPTWKSCWFFFISLCCSPRIYANSKLYADKLLHSVLIKKHIFLQNFIMTHEICRGLTFLFCKAQGECAVINNNYQSFLPFAFNISDLKGKTSLALELYSLKMACINVYLLLSRIHCQWCIQYTWNHSSYKMTE